MPLGSGAPAIHLVTANYFTGRPNNFGMGNSGNAASARLDPEGMRISSDGKSVFVSDEYGPYVYQLDRASLLFVGLAGLLSAVRRKRR